MSHGYDFNRMLQQHLSEGASTPYRSTLHNIAENEQDDELTAPPTQTPRNSPAPPMYRSFTGVSHHEGPISASHDNSLLHSLYGQTGGLGPATTDLTTADMCLSTLYLHELYHRQSRRRGIRPQLSQQQIWQQPHQGPISPQQAPNADVGSASLPSSVTNTTRSTSATASTGTPPAERTPLLYPKRT